MTNTEDRLMVAKKTKHSEIIIDLIKNKTSVSDAFFVASRIYYGTGAPEIGRTRPDPAGIVVI